VTAELRNGYKIHSAGGKGLNQRAGGSIRVPWHIVQAVPPGTTFIPELTEDGILYRRVIDQFPSWAGGNGASAS
jgi:hypothetical protein